MDFGILGPLAAWDGEREVRLGGAKQRSVLAVLLLRGNELVPTTTLVDELWGERPPPTAVKAVQIHVSHLRKLLGEGVLETRPTGYMLTLGEDALDAQRFEALLERGMRLLAEGAAEEAARVLRECLGLWRGPPLADFQFESFARNEIGRLEELRLVALEQRLEADLALGRAREIVGELEALVRDQPLREGLSGLLMLALYRAGRQADALVVYQNARARLVEELGLDPSQSLQRLEKAILIQDPALDLARPVPVIAPPPDAPSRRSDEPRTVVCENCGTGNFPDALYCQACGRPQVVDSLETRKTVTVLFCEIAALTEAGGQLDPESLRLVTSRCLKQAAEVLERHGAKVETSLGDEVMAVFGVPAVHEDDALRAVRAAAELRESVVLLEPGLGPGTGLEVRIGVNTGAVVASGQGAGREFVTGDAVLVGKLLEQAAAPGEILLGAGTHALVAHAIEATTLEPLEVTGKRQNVAAFRLETIDASATAIPRREDARLIGRAGELERLRALFEEVAAGRGARQATVIGEPGIGKSSLARAFLAEFAGAAQALIGRCQPYGEGATFWPLREVLGQAGRDEGILAGKSHEVFAAARRILVELAGERPLIVAFDDVQWAEPTFLDFVDYLAGRLGDARVLLLCLGRPQLAERRPAWLLSPAVGIVLEPLSEGDSETLLEVLGVAAAVRPQIAEAAEGNPLFVEQLAAIADEFGVLGKMPDSIRGVLHERIDRLDREERSALERAAVAGRSFSLDAVLDLTPEEEHDDVASHLLALARKRFLRPDMTASEEGFRFHHALIRDAAYDGIPKTNRADLHERAAARLEREAAADGLVGYHLEQAFRLRSELGRDDLELGARAGRLLRAAGKSAFGHADLPATISLFERAGALLPGREAAQLLPDLVQALFEAGRFAEADNVLDEAIEQAQADPLLEARARVEQQFVCAHAESGRRMSEASEVADAALGVFAANNDEVGQCRALRLRAHTEWIQGRVTGADEAWQRAADHARAAGEERELFEILTWRASATAVGPVPVVEGIRLCEEIREEVRRSPVAVAVTIQPLAALHAMLGQFDHARSLILEANAILGELDRLQSAVSHHEALVELLAGDPAEAEALLLVGYERLEEMGEKSLLATTAAMLARAAYELQNYEEADRYCAISESSGAAEDLSVQVPARAVRAKLLARSGRIEEAEELAHEAVRLIAQTDMVIRHGDALLDLAEVWRIAGRAAEAEAAASNALELFNSKGNLVSAAYARSRIALVAPI